jgi:5-oxoprolinase (ATP-hydrolysing) subunit A
MIEAGAIVTASGKRLPTAISSVCVHSDSPHAVETARRLRARLEAAAVKIASFVQ